MTFVQVTAESDMEILAPGDCIYVMPILNLLSAVHQIYSLPMIVSGYLIRLIIRL